jgi:uncharacterized protein (TIGR03382 family)
VNDGALDSDEATVSITVAGGNSIPSALDISTTTTREVAVPITLTAWDDDGDELSYLLLTMPAHGMLSGEPPDITYVPTAGYIGVDSFTYQVSDGVDRSNTATVSVMVSPRPSGGCGGCTSSPGGVGPAAGGVLLLLEWLSRRQRSALTAQ